MINKRNFNKVLMAGLLVVMSIFLFKLVLAADPTGATINEIRTERAPNDTAMSDDALAGNITELNVVGISTTQTWQGYVGNISGTIQLADASDNVLYNWTLAQPSGEIYATRNVTINWRSVQCFNYSASGEKDNTGEVPGSVNGKGMNLSQLEDMYGVVWDDVDGVNETFYLYDYTTGAGGGAGQHDLFYTANLQFSEGECVSTRVYGDSGQGVSNEYEEVILYDPDNDAVVFTSIIEEDKADLINGFDTRDYDFEMLVLENGHGTDISTSTYYFFVELE